MTMTTKEEIIATGPTTNKAGVTETEALVVAYNAVEQDIMHGIPNRLSVLAKLRELIMQAPVSR